MKQKQTKKTEAPPPKMDVDEEILHICAFRYALRRHSYVVGSVADTLIRRKDEFTPQRLKFFIKEIDEVYPEYTDNLDIDMLDWNKVRNTFRKMLGVDVRCGTCRFWRGRSDECLALKGLNVVGEIKLSEQTCCLSRWYPKEPKKE